jgi:PKD repeat protein
MLRAQWVPVACFTGNVIGSCQMSYTDLSWYTPVSWMWSFPGGSPATSTLQNPVITYSTPGIYDVTLTVSNGSGSDTLTMIGVVNATTCYFDPTVYLACDTSSGSPEIKSFVPAAVISPSPFDDFISIDLSDQRKDICTFRLFDVFNRQVKNIVLSDNMRLNAGDLRAGIYFYRLETGGQILQTGKIIKR